MEWNKMNEMTYRISLLCTVMPSKIKYSDKFSYDIFSHLDQVPHGLL